MSTTRSKSLLNSASKVFTTSPFTSTSKQKKYDLNKDSTSTSSNKNGTSSSWYVLFKNANSTEMRKGLTIQHH